MSDKSPIEELNALNTELKEVLAFLQKVQAGEAEFSDSTTSVEEMTKQVDKILDDLMEIVTNIK